MSVVAVPDTTFDIVTTPARTLDAPQRVLFVGQQTALGDVTSGSLTTDIGVTGEEDTFFGRDSMLAAGIRAFRKINKVTRVDAIALDDAVGSVAANGTITVIGLATVAATVTVSVQSARLYTVTVNIQPDDTANDIASAIGAAFSNFDDAMFEAQVSSGTVALLCKNKGTIGNSLGIKISEDTPGLNFLLNGFNSGAVDPDVSNVFDVIGEARYQTIVYPSNYDLAPLKSLLDSRFNVPGRVLDGVAIMADTAASVAEFDTKYGSFSTFATVVPNKFLDSAYVEAGGLLELDFTIASKIAAIRSLRLTPGANISSLVVGSASGTSTQGGISLSTLPYANTPIPDSTIIDTQSWWTRDEQLALKALGLTVIGNNVSETEVILGEAVTLEGKNNSTFTFLNAVDASSAAREYFFNNNLAQYAQVQLTPGDKIPGAPMVNATDIRLFQLSLYKDLANAGVTPKGSRFEAFFKDNLTVSIDFATGTVNIDAVLPLVSAVREIKARLNVTFSTN